ncbi:cation diffusion facilitator family transporter [Butyrivibrio sp. AC2005]|uniref:cation diffusion facilitator family transporter n=1 Tax=Butyrivibrio sp. AC2005 TaxID=1280672 RepID=UPI0004189CA8|nr:cation transporter [Butyrivibrio sp. AC2005]
MQKNVLAEQKKVAILLIIYRIPEFVTSLIAAAASGSMVVWLEFIENASILIPGIIIVILSGKLSQNLKFTFNYGTGKVEAISALSCEMFDLAGIFCVVFFAIRKIIMPDIEEDFLAFALVVSIIGLLIDIFIYYKEKSFVEKEHSRMIHSAFVAARNEFVFDAISIVTLIIGIIFEKKSWIRYFSPIVCVVVSLPLAYIVVHHLTDAIRELSDLTLDEESQLKILKALNEFYEYYDELGEIKSRISGNDQYVDIELCFKQDMPFREVSKVSEDIRKRVSDEIGGGIVNVVIL